VAAGRWSAAICNGFSSSFSTLMTNDNPVFFSRSRLFHITLLIISEYIQANDTLIDKILEVAVLVPPQKSILPSLSSLKMAVELTSFISMVKKLDKASIMTMTSAS